MKSEDFKAAVRESLDSSDYAKMEIDSLLEEEKNTKQKAIETWIGEITT